MRSPTVDGQQEVESGRRLTVRIPARLAQQAEAAAKADDRSLGSLIRVALAAYLDRP